MKTVRGWLSDPYVHVFAVALVLIRLATASGTDDARADSGPLLKACRACSRTHYSDAACQPIVAVTAEAVDRE